MQGKEFLSKLLRQTPFNKIHPQVAVFLKNYLEYEKIVEFEGKYVINTHFPPFPSPAFDNMAEQFNSIVGIDDRRLFSVTLAVTNRCGYSCWHCYNAGRSQQDLPTAALRETVRQLQELGAAIVTLTGGSFLNTLFPAMIMSFKSPITSSFNPTFIWVRSYTSGLLSGS